MASTTSPTATIITALLAFACRLAVTYPTGTLAEPLYAGERVAALPTGVSTSIITAAPPHTAGLTDAYALFADLSRRTGPAEATTAIRAADEIFAVWDAEAMPIFTACSVPHTFTTATTAAIITTVSTIAFRGTITWALSRANTLSSLTLISIRAFPTKAAAAVSAAGGLLALRLAQPHVGGLSVG